MPQMNMVQAINDALRLEMRRDDARRRPRRGRRQGRRRLPRDAGPLRRVRRRPRHRHAALARAASSAPRSAWRSTASCRSRRSSSPTSSSRRYDQIVSELAKYPLPLRRRVPGEAGDPHAGRRRHPRRPLPLAVARGALHPRRGPQGRLPVEPVRREGPARSRRSATPIRCSSSSRSASTARRRARCPRATTRCRSARRSVVREGEHVTVIAWGAMLYEALEAAEQAAAQGIDVRGRRSAHALAARHRHDRREREEDGPRRRRARGAEDLRLRRARSSRSSTRRRFLHLEAPPVRVTGFDTPFPYTLEMEYLPLAHRILPAIVETARY